MSRPTRRQLLQLCHRFIQEWTRQPMREALDACYGDLWQELRIVVKWKHGVDTHVMTPRPKQAAG